MDANKRKPKVKLTGRDGNAFAVLGSAQAAMKKAGCYTEDEIKAFLEKAMSGDYDNLLRTVMEYCEVS